MCIISNELNAVEHNARQVVECVRGQPDRGEDTRVDKRARKRKGNAVQKVKYHSPLEAVNFRQHGALMVGSAPPKALDGYGIDSDSAIFGWY